MDPVEAVLSAAISATVGGGISEVTKQGSKFLAAALGHPNEDIGTVLGTKYHERLNRGNKVLEQAGMISLNLGFEPRKVADRVFIPAIEAASLEENPELQAKWANLIAFAENPGMPEVSPVYAAILKELTPRDARFLDAIFERGEDRVQGNDTLESGLTLEFSESELAGVFEKARLSKGVMVTIGELDRSHLATYVKDMNNMRFCIDVFKRHGVFDEITPQVRKDFHGDIVPAVPDAMAQRLHFTVLGRKFVYACRPPAK